MLVRALPALDGVHLAIVGSDDRHGLAGELVQLAVALGVEDRVHLTGPWPSVGPPLELYGDADVCALASAHENFGMVAAEAASAGTPVLLTDRCGIAELLGDGAAVVVSYDLQAVSAGLRRLLGDAPLRARLGEAALAVAAEWSWPRVVELQEDLYRSVLGHE
jgi:glycosyltransferase involved in cell wall biosynthesis